MSVRSERRGRVASVFSLLLIGILFLVPLLILAGYAVAGQWRFPDLLPTTYSTRAFEFLFRSRRRLVSSLFNSAGYSLATVLFTFLISVAPARVLSRFSFRGRNLVEALLLAPVLVPSITFAMGVNRLFIGIGLIDTWPAVVLVLGMFSYPYMLRALTAGFSTLPENLWICARNLGAGQLRIVTTVYLPLLVPAAVAGGTVVFLVAFSEYFLVFLIGGGAVDSYTGYLYPFITSSDRSVAALLSLIFLVVPVLLFLCLEAGVTRIYRNRGVFS